MALSVESTIVVMAFLTFCLTSGVSAFVRAAEASLNAGALFLSMSVMIFAMALAVMVYALVIASVLSCSARTIALSTFFTCAGLSPKTASESGLPVSKSRVAVACPTAAAAKMRALICIVCGVWYVVLSAGM
ncbi:hypothetical protein GQ54DRAFT_162043 [Martensiomyces pterosporus]|nr:hypothetical protein GQ54DRAFT_162043 [Martensiomyces pterosporus]